VADVPLCWTSNADQFRSSVSLRAWILLLNKDRFLEGKDESK
jgi:hypothetical protein